MTREAEVTAYLASDPELGTLAPGGVYAHSTFPDLGITNQANASDVWAGGVFQNTVIVRERAPVPDYRVVDEAERIVSISQIVGIHVYALDPADIPPILDRIFALMQGHSFDNAYPTVWVRQETIGDVPELPRPTKTARADYQIVSIRQAESA